MKKNTLLKIVIVIVILLIISIILLLAFLKQKEKDGSIIQEVQKNQNESINGIEPNEVNQYKEASISGASLASTYLRDYTTNALQNPKEAYQKLEEEYRKIRFHDSYEEYLQYINQLTMRLLKTNADKYLISQKENYREFNILDNYGTAYLIKENAIMDYTIQLDNYTIPSEEFKSKYLRADQKTKVETDLDMFFSMINTKDYSHAYEKLDDGFKQNYFPTQAEFETYMKQYFFDYNYIGINSRKNEGDIFIYDISIKDGTASGAKEMTKTFLIKLGEELDFDISFNVE